MVSIQLIKPDPRLYAGQSPKFTSNVVPLMDKKKEILKNLARSSIDREGINAVRANCSRSLFRVY